MTHDNIKYKRRLPAVNTHVPKKNVELLQTTYCTTTTSLYYSEYVKVFHSLFLISLSSNKKQKAAFFSSTWHKGQYKTKCHLPELKEIKKLQSLPCATGWYFVFVVVLGVFYILLLLVNVFFPSPKYHNAEKSAGVQQMFSGVTHVRWKSR